MIFMSQSGINDPALSEQWSTWYVEHLRIMQTVDGIDSAVRFQTTTPGWPPSLALYSIRSAAVFNDPYYLTIRGMGPWAQRIEKRFYQRNLFEAATDTEDARLAPVVPQHCALIVTDQTQPTLLIEDLSFLWLKSVGLDQTTPYRGIAVVPQQHAETLRDHPQIAIYQ